jgi:hypothetical protein
LTRRDFIRTAAVAATGSRAPARLVVPIHRVMDGRARCSPEQLHHFWWSIWPEASRAFSRGGIELQTSDGPGEIRRSAGDRPILIGLRRGVLNLVLTDHIPMKWDTGRALAGVTTIYDGYHLCMIALQYAHTNQVPLVSLNTCVHEILHALLLDIVVTHPRWYQAGEREFRTDWVATSLWLFRPDNTLRKSAQTYLDRLRQAGAAQTPAAR